MSTVLRFERKPHCVFGMKEITAYMKDNSLLISAPKSSITLLTPDTHQAKAHPSIFIEDSRLPLVKCPRILGVYLIIIFI